MTRRGSVIYYFSAVTLGSFFLAATYYIHFFCMALREKTSAAIFWSPTFSP